MTDTNGNKGRDSAGRFAGGNRCAVAPRQALKPSDLRRALLATVTKRDIRAIARALLQKASDGDTAAIRLALLYCVGPATDGELVEQLERIEREIGNRGV